MVIIHRLFGVYSLNHRLLRLILTLLKLEISKQTNAKAVDSNLFIKKQADRNSKRGCLKEQEISLEI